jgi:putative tryptophan/tyrosine transport system substrate-binding protein
VAGGTAENLHMDRRAFLAVTAAGGLIAMPAFARAQQAGKIQHIGFLSLTSGPTYKTEAFRQRLRELLPKATRVAVLDVHGYTAATRPYLEQMRAAAQQMGVQLIVQEVTEAGDLPGAFTAMQRERAQALDVRASPFSTDNAKRIVKLAAQHRLPAMYDARSFVEAGGLVSYRPSLPEMFRRAAFYVDRILKGAKPADLPVEQPTKFELVINVKAAKALGLTIPPAILARADHVIQ